MCGDALTLTRARRPLPQGYPPCPPPLQGICRFLHLEPLDDRSLFLRTIERPIKSRDPLGLKRLQARGRERAWQDCERWGLV